MSGLRTVVNMAARVASYAELRAYAGRATAASLEAAGIGGSFVRDDADVATADDAGTVIVAANGKRWKRVFSGPVQSAWFGLAADGVTDDTAKVQALVDLAAAKGWEIAWSGAVVCGPITANGAVRWRGHGGFRFVLKAAVFAAGAFHFSLGGARPHLTDIEFDGNQAALVAGQGCNGVVASGVSPTMKGVKVRRYPGNGYVSYSANVGQRRGIHLECNFDDNAGLGFQTYAASYHDFIGCTFDRNGYGFQKSRADYADNSHGFLAFGVALRMRSHHFVFSECMARDNGRDGFNVNQGSYAVKFGRCLAHGNDDGGFTVAADNTGSGLAGEGEGCYDLEFDQCEAYNNYTSGLAIYQASHNISVRGGRYYNNHRVAGNQAAASSYFNGIYVAGGSTGIEIDGAVTYDDRQARAITAVNGGVLTAPGWLAGNKGIYPKVSILGADGAFKGYGKITAEAAGSVTITPTGSNGAAGIAVGDYVSQAVQHNGVFLDNACVGRVIVTGAGHRVGAMGGSITGRNIIAGSFASGQNIVLPGERLGDVEFLVNPSFDVDTSNGWAYNFPGGGSVSRYSGGPFAKSAGSLKMVGGTSPAEADGSTVADALARAVGEFVEFGVWAYATGQGDASVTLFWNLGGAFKTTTVTHPGGGWRFLRIGAFVDGSVTSLFPRLRAATGKTAYFDNARFRAVDSGMDAREGGMPSRYLGL